MIKSVILASIVHILALFALIFSFDWNIDSELEPVNIIQATTVDVSKVAKQIEKLQKIERKKKREEDLRLAKLAKETQQARRDRKLEQQRLDDLQKKREQVKQQQLQLEKDRREQQKRLDELQQRNEAAAQKREQLARIRADKEREAKRERALRRRQQELDELQAQMDKELMEREAAAVAAEKNVVNDPNQEIVATETQKFIAIVTSLVTRNWIKPPGTEGLKDLKCEVNVRLMPTGDVLFVNVTKSSGNAQFDRSVEAAVKKAAPYPIPTDINIFDNTREIKFIFTPPQESS